MTTNLVYGSDTGGTRKVAEAIAAKLPDCRVIDVKLASRTDFEECDLLILGSPTCQLGEAQEDWDRGLRLLAEANLTGRTVALFGTGDQITYAETFADAVGILYDAVTARGARVIGETATTGYTYDASRAEREGRFVGLILDEDNQRDKTPARVAAWVASLPQ